MTNTGSILEELAKLARKDEKVKKAFEASRKSEKPYVEFCRIANELGFELSLMDLIDEEERYISLLERSVNGGGANHSVLKGSDDFYEQFFLEIEGK